MKRIIGCIVIVLLAVTVFFAAYRTLNDKNDTDADIAYNYDDMPEQTGDDHRTAIDLNIDSDVVETFDEGGDINISGDDQADRSYKINVCLGDGPVVFDPAFISTPTEGSLVLHAFEGLMKYTPEDSAKNISKAKVVFGQAKDYSISDDGLTYTFALRDGIFWSDGSPVTASDFVFAWKRLVDPSNDTYYGDVLNGIVKNAKSVSEGKKDAKTLGIKAIDDKTLEITLEEKCPYFLRLLALPCLSPVKESKVDMTKAVSLSGSEGVISNGAYIVDSADDKRLVMVKNERYYNTKSICPAEITFHFDEKSTATDKYATGEYVFVSDVSGGYTDEIVSSDEYRLTDSDDSNLMIFNLSEMKDWRLRAAICLCIDRDALTEEVFGIHAKPLWSVVPNGITDSEKKSFENGFEVPPMEGGFTDVFGFEDSVLTTYDDKRALAVKLFEKAVAEGSVKKGLSYRYTYNLNYLNMKIANALKAQIESILDIKIELVVLNDEDYVKALAKHDFDMARFNLSAVCDDPAQYLDVFEADGYFNYGHFYEYDYEYYRDQAGKLPAGEQRDAYLRACEGAMFTQYAFGVAPLYSVLNDCAVKNNIKGVFCTMTGEYMFCFTRETQN